LRVGKDRLVEDLTRMGIEEGDHLALGVSLKSIGYVEGGPDALLDALLETVGDDGTIFLPAHTMGFRLYLLKPGKRVRMSDGRMFSPWDYVFDPDTTPPVTGLVPTTLWKRNGSFRSSHPINSIVAMGKDARYLTSQHDDGASPFSPYSTLADMDGKALFIGLNGRLVGLRHRAQRLAGLTEGFPALGGVRYRRRDSSIGLYKRVPSGCAKELPRLNGELFERGVLHRGNLGEAECLTGKAEEILECLSNRLRSNPERVICDDPRCLWCRCIETRYDLRHRMKGEHLFQRSRLARSVTSVINSLRLRNWYWAEKGMGLYARALRLAEKAI